MKAAEALMAALADDGGNLLAVDGCGCCSALNLALSVDAACDGATKLATARSQTENDAIRRTIAAR